MFLLRELRGRVLFAVRLIVGTRRDPPAARNGSERWCVMRRLFGKGVAAVPPATVLALVVLAISSSMPLPGQPPIDVTPGRVHGEIVFRDASPGVLAFLSQKPVEAIGGGWWLPVALYEIGDSWQPRARAPYTAENQLAAADRYVAASYDMNPNVPDTGDDLVLSVSSVSFDGGGSIASARDTTARRMHASVVASCL